MSKGESFDRRTISFTGITREAIENNHSREAIKIRHWLARCCATRRSPPRWMRCSRTGMARPTSLYLATDP